MMINWEAFCINRSWPNFEVLSQQSPGGTEEDHKTSIVIARRRGRESKTGPPEYEARAPFTSGVCISNSETPVNNFRIKQKSTFFLG
jgi:hypothetical protein